MDKNNICPQIGYAKDKTASIRTQFAKAKTMCIRQGYAVEFTLEGK